jgi:hypothetical protein
MDAAPTVVIVVVFAALLVLARKLHRRSTRAKLLAALDEVAASTEAMQLAERALERSAAATATWKRKFWEMHGVVEQVLGERDVWREMYRGHVSEHLEGQAMLEHKIVSMRQHVIRAVATTNHLIKENKLKRELVTTPKEMLPLDGPPVGQAEEYYGRMKKMLMKDAPAAFDALMKRSEIADQAVGATKDASGANGKESDEGSNSAPGDDAGADEPSSDPAVSVDGDDDE